MKERPIILSAWEVRAIIAGTKTRITRPLKHQPPERFQVPEVCVPYGETSSIVTFSEVVAGDYPMWARHQHSPFGAPGDVLIGKETWKAWPDGQIFYAATPDKPERSGTFIPLGNWRSSITMPRWAARIVLRVESESVGRVQDISAEDAIADGARDTRPDDPLWESVAIQDFRALWDATYAKRGLGYDANCWTWSATFARLAPGTDGRG